TNTMKMTKYILFNGIQWPSEVFSTRVDGDLHLLVAEKLQKLEVAPAGFRDIGHQEVAALLADRAKQARQGSK
ncbi:MAG: hypothetical protein KC656_11590, partial [Myxococcales bacterium]|nr:hypothetical protein [Myxococcales bacterium]